LRKREPDADLAYERPLARRHIIPHGSYHFRDPGLVEGERAEGYRGANGT
jgi:hypothetical protein